MSDKDPSGFRTRSDCRVCGSRDLQTVIDFGPIPLAGGFLRPEEIEDNRSYPLTLVRCRSCTLMQVLEVVDPEIIFRNYSYASSTTRTLISHFEEMAGYLVKLADSAGKVVVEFGCNDGVLIRPLRQEGAIAVGVDPSDVAKRASEEQGWPLVPGYFNSTTAAQVREQFGPARIVTANNVFAHSDDLDSLMSGVDLVLEDEGLFVFEVHYQGDLIEQVQFDTVYHEHLCYYSVTSLARLLGRFGFGIVDLLFVGTHSGSIRVVAARSGSSWPVASIVPETLEAEKKWNIEAFVAGVEDRRRTLRSLVEDLKSAGRSVVAYGAAGRATVLLNYCQLGPDLIDYVVDVSPLRFGKLVPGVLVPIVHPDVFRGDYPDYAILTAWNYEAEVRRNEQEFLTGRGRLILPLPDVRIVGAA